MNQFKRSLVIDNCLNDNNDWYKHRVYRTMFMNGYFYRILCIITMENPLDISKHMLVVNNYEYNTYDIYLYKPSQEVYQYFGWFRRKNQILFRHQMRLNMGIGM
jgi:hypothetical protein